MWPNIGVKSVYFFNIIIYVLKNNFIVFTIIIIPIGWF